MILLIIQSPPPTQSTSLIHDPQFWIATVVALIAVAFLARSLLPRFGVRLSKGTASKTTLTVGGKAIKK